jgi:cardiolipin synthase (CMP-forming)
LSIPLLRLPNLISLARLLAAPVIAWLLYVGRFSEALFLLLAAGLSDWLDGYAARKLGISDRLGVVLDPLADKVLMIVVFVSLGLLELIPWWLFISIVVRDLVIVTGAMLLRRLRGRQEFLPSLMGKVSTFFQIVLALLAVVYAAFPFEVVEIWKITGVVLTAIFTLLSGLDYVRQGIQMARQPSLEKN